MLGFWSAMQFGNIVRLAATQIQVLLDIVT